MKNSVYTLLAIGFLLAACSQSSSSDNKDLSAPTGFDTKSCVYNVTDGGRSDLSALKKRNIVQVSFGKEFNQALFDGIASANILDTMDYINQTNVQIYKADPVETSDCTRNLFESAPYVTGDLSRTLSDAGDPSGKSVILGLYLHKNSKDLPSTKDKAAIIVRKNSNRWTLVHEFMHHLFQLRTEENHIDVDSAKEQLMLDVDALKALPDDIVSTTEGTQKAAELMARLAENLDVVYVHYTLEEMTIEKFLKEKAASGKLRYAPTNSNWYIRTSGKKVLESNEQLLPSIEAVRDMAELKGLNAQVSRLDNALSVMRNRNSEIRNIMASYREDKAMSAPLALRAEATEEVHEGCSHEKAMDEIHDAIMNLN